MDPSWKRTALGDPQIVYRAAETWQRSYATVPSRTPHATSFEVNVTNTCGTVCRRTDAAIGLSCHGGKPCELQLSRLHRRTHVSLFRTAWNGGYLR